MVAKKVSYFSSSKVIVGSEDGGLMMICDMFQIEFL